MEPSKKAPAHLSLALIPCPHRRIKARQGHLCPLSLGGLRQKCGSTLGRRWEGGGGVGGGGITRISGALLLDKVQTKRAFCERDTGAGPHTPGWPGES